jgi:hypothetical protein
VTQRVLIQGGQASAMRVSMPGIDVTTADVDQTVFDSRWSGLIPYRTGQLTSVSQSTSTFSFGETLDQPPMCVCHFVTLANGSPTSTFRNTPTIFRGNDVNNWWYVVVSTSYVQFNSLFGNQASLLTFTLFKRVGG